MKNTRKYARFVLIKYGKKHGILDRKTKLVAPGSDLSRTRTLKSRLNYGVDDYKTYCWWSLKDFKDYAKDELKRAAKASIFTPTKETLEAILAGENGAGFNIPTPPPAPSPVLPENKPISATIEMVLGVERRLKWWEGLIAWLEAIGAATKAVNHMVKANMERYTARTQGPRYVVVDNGKSCGIADMEAGEVAFFGICFKTAESECAELNSGHRAKGNLIWDSTEYAKRKYGIVCRRAA